jgi:ribonuclease P protein component
MLARGNRLRRGRDIDVVMRQGRFAGAGDFYAKVRPNKSPQSRLVVVVGKKVSKKAVVRNRIRRRLSGVFEANWQTVQPGYDIVVIVKADISEVPAAQLTAGVMAILERSKLILENHV